MHKMGFVKLLLTGLALAFFLNFLTRIYTFLWWVNIGKDVINHTPGTCNVVKGIVNGSEDLEILPGTDLALISSGIKFNLINPETNYQGKIYCFDFSKSNAGAVEVPLKNFPQGQKIFHPHGITVWTVYGKVSEDCVDNEAQCKEWADSRECVHNPVFMRKNCRLSCQACDDTEPKKYIVMVVNHQMSQVSVERFEFDTLSRELNYLETIKDLTSFRYMSDISATGERSFYFTNFQESASNSFSGRMESFIGLRKANLNYYDGKKTRQLEGNLAKATSVAQSLDKKRLYFNHFGDSEVRVYEVFENKSISLVQAKQMLTPIERINIDQTTGDLWIGGYSVLWKSIHLFLFDSSTKVPTQVVRIKVQADGLLTDDVTEAFSDNGEMISSGSVALHHQQALLIGSAADKAVYCQVYHV